MVYGIEADIAGLGLKSTMNTTLLGNIVPPGSSLTCSSIDCTAQSAVASVGPPGYLLYGTGGFAFGGTKVNSALVDTEFSSTSHPRLRLRPGHGRVRGLAPIIH